MQSSKLVGLERRYLVLVVLLAIGLYVIVPQLGDFRSSLKLLGQPNLPLAAAAIGLTVLTYLAAAATYSLLAVKRPPYSQVLLVQLAAMFVNRLLPAGIGALGANFAYLRRVKHSAAQASTVVAINNLLGGVGHSLIVVVTSAFYSSSSQVASNRLLSADSLLVAAAATIVLLIVLVIVIGKKRVLKFLSDVKKQLSTYRKRPYRLLGALLTSMLLTLSNIACLLFCAAALGVELPFAAIVLIFSLGLGAGTATPTPGGLGGFEAGLVAGFIAYGVPASAALAIALFYRLVSYWLPLVIGALAFAQCQRQHLFKLS